MISAGLEGRVALITGANNPHGIGAAIARALARQGVHIFLHTYRDSRAVASETDTPGEAFYNAQQTKTGVEVLNDLRALGIRAEVWEADLAFPENAPLLFNKAEETLGRVEILVNNACYWEGDSFLPAHAPTANQTIELWTSRSQTFDPSVFERLFAVNTRAVAHLMTEFTQRHLAQGGNWGRIINISTDGAVCFPSEITYGASKRATESYTRSAAMELGQFGITVNAISPGPIQTGWITPELEAALLPDIPMGRVGTPEDIADVAVFLTSEQARWVTAQVLHVGGGHAF